jgi:ubiquinone/menaquinone biosynthesis C-methylase UbiE
VVPTGQDITESDFEFNELLSLLYNFKGSSPNSLLDLGVGLDSRLAIYATQLGLIYHPTDVSDEAVAMLNADIHVLGLRWLARVGDIKNLRPYGENSYGMVHEGFVLANLASHEIPTALESCYRVTKRILILREHDWSSTFRHPERSEHSRWFLQTIRRYYEHFAIDMFCGRKLEESVKHQFTGRASSVCCVQTIQPADYHTKWIDSFCERTARHCTARGTLELAQEFKQFRELFKVAPIRFTPPALVTATVFKG